MTDKTQGIRRELARFILEQLQSNTLSKQQAADFLNELKKENTSRADIAIIGLSCRFPEAENKREFWKNLAEGKSSIRSFPRNRHADLAMLDNYDTKLFQGGFLNEVDKFDCEYFSIPPAVAQKIDPYQRILLENFVETIEDAGYSRTSLNGKSVGVFVGNDHTHRLFNSYVNFIDDIDFDAVTGSWTAVLASRISYLFNFRGPALVVDTACSSGLVALDSAIKSLRVGDCESALVAAANLFFVPAKGLVGNIENDDFTVRAFDRDASGTVWGEGVASLFLKPLDKALRDGDTIHGVIKGVALNNDGACNGLTAPNPKAQKEVIIKAWERAGIDPRDIDYIETHGTGTQLGDPIEIKGLKEAFGQFDVARQSCPIGSVKTNIGHTVAVAGLASIIKVVLGMQRKAIPPSINFNTPNPFINFCDSPVFVNDSLNDWPVLAEKRRLAGVSSFSLSGTNCHIVLEEAPPLERTQTDSTARFYAFPVSARNSQLLLKLVESLLDFLQSEESRDYQVGDLSYTASVGREHHKVRAICLVDSIEGLEDCLNKIRHSMLNTSVKGDAPKIFEAFKTPVAKSSELVSISADDLIDAKRGGYDALQLIAEYYVRGKMLNWPEIFDNAVRRVSMPAQPFIKQRLWTQPKRVFDTKTKSTVNSSETKIAHYDEDSISPEKLLADAMSVHNLFNDADALDNLIPQYHDIHFVVAYVWKETLGYENFSLDDDFYQLGGDSVTGAKIVNILSGIYNAEISISDILSASTLTDFSKLLYDQHGLTNPEQLTESTTTSFIQTLPDQKRYALSPAQKRMFLLEQLTPGLPVYNVNAVVKLSVRPDINAFNQAVNTLIGQHEILRNRFYLDEGTFYQCVCEKTDFTADEIFLASDVTGQILNNAIRAYIRPFDLNEPPLIRVGMVYQGDLTYCIFDMHHIITDGASMGLVISNLLRIHNGEVLDAQRLQYRDFAAWQNDLFARDVYRPQKDYWLNQFKDELPIAELRSDFPRPSYFSFKGNKTYFHANKGLADKLKRLAQLEGTTLFVLMLAAFNAFMNRLGAGNDIVIGTPVSGRVKRELQTMIGMFVNTLALRNNIDPASTFHTFLGQVKETTKNALANQDFPYEEFVKLLDIPREPGKNALFDIYFVLQNEDMGLSGIDIDVQEIPSTTSKFDITIEIRNHEEGLQISWEYATALFNTETIQRYGEQYLAILEAIVRQPSQQISQLTLFRENEREFLVDTINKTQTQFPEHCSLTQLFERQVEKSPDAIALRYNDEHMTYSELNECANKLQAYLVEQGVTPSDCIALHFDTGFPAIISMLAVLKSGAAYVPIELAMPAERKSSLLAECKPALLLHCTHCLPELSTEASTAPAFVNIEELELSNYSAQNPTVTVGGDALAYIIFTSGSTGKPKGTLIRHKSAVRVVCNTNYIQLTDEDVILQSASFGFDGSVFNIWAALLHGGELVLIDKAALIDMNAFADAVAACNVTVFFITTALFNALVDTQITKLKNVKAILTGGELASVSHFSKAVDYLGAGKIIHVYGPTETTVFATAYPVNTVAENARTIPIGRPIANTSLYVFNEDLFPVPCGVVGELYIGGAGVAIGYLNREALTKEKFIDNPIIPGERLYRTGDLVQWNNSSQLEFVGRTDHQVKIRGYRVELTEIEKVILSFNGVDKCLVVANRYEHGVIKLCAYVIFHSNCKESDTNLREYLHSKLPEYMVPTALCRLEKFPLNNNGKIDRKALPEPTDFVDHTDFKPPSKPEEQMLIDIWQGLLRIKRIGISDNFFSLGGDSIIAIQVISQLKERGYTAETAHIFQYQTIEELAEHISVAKPQETQAFEDNIVSDYEAGKLDQSELDDIFADLNIL